MELFNEIYSCYYHTVRHILAEAAGHSVNMKEMEQICKNQAFQETALAVLPKLTKGEWGWENNFTCTIVFIISRFWNNQIYE